MAVEEILVAVSCDEASRAVAGFGIYLAEKLGARLTAVAVLDEVVLRELVAYRVFIEQEAQEYARDILEQGQRFLRWVADAAAVRGVRCQTSMLRGAVHEAVLRAAAELPAHLLVIGEVERLGAGRGRVSEGQRILAGARCPVVIVKYPRLAERPAR